jgi:hypothetical protein
MGFSALNQWFCALSSCDETLLRAMEVSWAGRATVPDRRQENLIVAGPSLTGAGSITENARSVVKSFPIF